MNRLAWPPRAERLLLALGLVLATLLVYWPVVGFGFTGLDDQLYVTSNPHVLEGLSLRGLVWAFTALDAANWHPLTWISLMVDSSIGGGSAGVYHVTNVVLHLLSALLLFLALDRMTGSLRRSAFVALLFAVHPLHVESVAWISERKDVLSATFWFLTLLAYARYAARPTGGRYAAILLSFALGLLGKPMLVTLPVVLLLLDVWPLVRLRLFSGRMRASGRTTSGNRMESSVSDGTPAAGQQPGREANEKAWPLVREKLPLFAMSAASSAVTLFAQSHGGTVGSLEAYPLWARAANAIVSYAAYLVSAVWPSGLAVLYPHPGTAIAAMPVFASGVALVVLTVVAVRASRTRPYVTSGWLWYLVTLVPVIGLVQVGVQARADRYTYIPLVGIFVAVTWAGAEAWTALAEGAATPRSASAPAVSAPTTAAGTTAAGTTAARTTAARTTAARTAAAGTTGARTADSRTTDPRTTDKPATAARGTAGSTTAERATAPRAIPRRTAAALALLMVAIVVPLMAAAHVQVRFWRDRKSLFARLADVETDQAPAHNTLGTILYTEGALDEAMREFRRAIELDPRHFGAHNNLGLALERLGRADDALKEFRESIRINPRYAEGHEHLARLLLAQGHASEAVPHLIESLRLKPHIATTAAGLASALLETGDVQGAVLHAREALDQEPRLLEAHMVLGAASMLQSDFDGAVGHFSQAVAIDPEMVDAHANLGGALLQQGYPQEAIEQCHQALRREPGHTGARTNLALALLKQGRRDEARKELSEVLRLDPANARASRYVEQIDSAR